MANSSWVVTIPGAGLPFGENRSATEKPTRYAASVSLSVGLNRHGGDSGETSWSHNACTVPAHKASFLALRPPQSSPWRISESSACRATAERSEEHTSELQSLMRISYAVFCLKK